MHFLALARCRSRLLRRAIVMCQRQDKYRIRTRASARTSGSSICISSVIESETHLYVVLCMFKVVLNYSKECYLFDVGCWL